MSVHEFMLKTVPPRLPRDALERAPLQRAGDSALDRTAIAVIAPAGFGKTTLLAQWRRRRMAQGAQVAWLRADAQDDPARFAMGLLHALHTASASSAFEGLRSQLANDTSRPMETLSELLSEVAALGKPTVLMIDDAERLPEATVRGVLLYLLHNAPPNLHIVIGSRGRLPLDAWDLVAKGELTTLGVEDLRLSLEESTELLRKRFGQRLTLDDIARLHEATSGWPLGLQLVSATIERAPDLGAAIESLSGRHGDIERFFFDALIAGLSPDMADFLVRTALLEHLNDDVCAAVTGCASAREHLARLQEDTPIAMSTGLDDWVVLHPLARDFLLGRFETLPAEDRRALHARASHWFADHKRYHEAGIHALAAGEEKLAESYAGRALWTLTMQGRLLEAREWLDRIPRATINDDLDLKLVAAWVRSIGESHADAYEVANAILVKQDLTPMQRFLASRAAFTAAIYGDRPGPLPDILKAWEQARGDVNSPIEDPIEAIAHANARACVALHNGETRRARAIITRLPPGLDPHAAPLPLAHRLMLIGVTYVQDGDAFRAEAVLAPALAAYERSQGRRGMVASSFAAALAAAWFDSDRVAEAEALLAYRMDVIDRTAVPDNQLVAYRTLSRIALARGDERRALLLLDELTSLAEAREYPRLAMHAIVERIRIHALQARHGIVDGLLRELDAMAPMFDEFDWLAFKPRYIVQRAIANAYAAIARNDMDAAATHLDATKPFLTRARPTRDGLTVEVLRAVIARRQRDPNALALLTEARDLARLAGWERLLPETYPLAVQMGAELDADTSAVQAPDAPTGPRPQRPRTALRGGLLTMKEAEILALLDKGMSNKAIARAMEISHETVKWHIKNLSLKLSAGTRKHAVDRARLLGLLVH